MSSTSSADVEPVAVEETAPSMQPGFSFAVEFEALHSRLALELRKKCTQTRPGAELLQECSKPDLELDVGMLKVGSPEGETRFVALQKQLNEVRDEVQRWRATMGDMLQRYERRKNAEFVTLREESAIQVRVAGQQAEQQVHCVTKLHVTKVQELYDLFMGMQQQQPLTAALLESIQTRTNRQLREVVDSQQQQIQALQASNFLFHLKVQSLDEDAARLRLSLAEKEDVLTSLTTEFEELIPKLHGYIAAREHLLTTTRKEQTRDAFQQLELSLRNEQRENTWMKRALQDNKRKRADRVSRLQQQVTDLAQAVAEKDDIIGILARGFSLSSLKDAFPAHWQREPGDEGVVRFGALCCETGGHLQT